MVVNISCTDIFSFNHNSKCVKRAHCSEQIIGSCKAKKSYSVSEKCISMLAFLIILLSHLLTTQIYLRNDAGVVKSLQF